MVLLEEMALEPNNCCKMVSISYMIERKLNRVGANIATSWGASHV